MTLDNDDLIPYVITDDIKEFFFLITTRLHVVDGEAIASRTEVMHSYCSRDNQT